MEQGATATAVDVLQPAEDFRTTPETLPHALGLLELLPADLLARHIWRQLPRRDRIKFREASRGAAQYVASEFMVHLKVLVCRASLRQLTSLGRTLHQRFPNPASLELRLLPPASREPYGGGGGGGSAGPSGGTEAERCGSTAILSYFLSELGVATSLTALSLQGWQELSARDIHHVAASYPKLTRLHLAGLPYNNYLAGSSLESLGRASPPWLREVVVDTQLVLEPQAAFESLAHLPRLASLVLTGVPLLPSLELPLSRLGSLTRLGLTFEHKHAHSEQQLLGLAALTRLRNLALDFMQLGTGSSLWSAGWLLTQVLSHLTGLTTLCLPRAFLYDKSHPYFPMSLGALTGLVDLALGSVILSHETATAAAADVAGHVAVGNGSGGSGAINTGVLGETGVGEEGREGTPLQPRPLTSTSASASLVRPWRRLALGAAMPCYLEELLPLLLGGGGGGGGGLPTAPVASERPGLGTGGLTEAAVRSSPTAAEASAGAATSLHGSGSGDGGPAGGAEAAESGKASPLPVSPFSTPTRAIPGVGGGSGGLVDGSGAVDSRAGGGGGGGLDLLELSTPCTLQMVQLLQRFVRQDSQAWPGTTPVSPLSSSPSMVAAAAAAAVSRWRVQGSGRGGGGVREVRLMLRLAANWTEVVAAAAVLSPALSSLALLPTYLYGSGTMMTPQIVSTVAASLPLLEHLELYRLNNDPRDVTCLADMPCLRFVLLGLAEEARERRGANHPADTVRALLAALHAKRRHRGGARGTGRWGSSCDIGDE
ncbi:hypothetical protein VaNZ11_005812, partial [Volvox africanus]